MADPHNYYQTLKVSPTATTAEIKQAFRRLARQYHPDLHPHDPTAQEKFRRLVVAYDVLVDPVQRCRYDRNEPNGNFSRDRSEESSNTALDLYSQGVQKAAAKNYQGAIASYTAALESNPHFVDAYVKRAAAHSLLGNDRAVLEDCNRALNLDPQQSQAHYYRGRARFRLGYTQSSLEAFTQAILLNSDYAQAYYRRGIAYRDLQEHALAFADLKKASLLFHCQHNWDGYDLAENALSTLKRQHLRLVPGVLGDVLIEGVSLLTNTLTTAGAIALNPTGNLLHAYTQLGKVQAVGVGFMSALLATVCWVVLLHDRLNLGSAWAGLQVVLASSIPFWSGVALSAIARLLGRCRGNWSGDVFVSGIALLPLGGLALIYGAIATQVLLFSACLVLVGCYTVLLLYGGHVQIIKLPESLAVLMVPIKIFLGGWLTLWIYSALPIWVLGS